MSITNTRSKLIMWPHPSRGPWTLEFHWVVEHGDAKLVGLDVHGFPGEVGDLIGGDPSFSPERVTATLLRQIPIAALSNEGYRSELDWWKEQVDINDPMAHDFVAGMVGKPPAKGGRKPLTAKDLRDVSRVYRLGGAKPVLAVADHFHISPSAAAKRVARAREGGFLAPATSNQGRSQ